MGLFVFGVLPLWLFFFGGGEVSFMIFFLKQWRSCFQYYLGKKTILCSIIYNFDNDNKTAISVVIIFFLISNWQLAFSFGLCVSERCSEIDLDIMIYKGNLNFFIYFSEISYTFEWSFYIVYTVIFVLCILPFQTLNLYTLLVICPDKVW